jgi:uncharacterized protein (TIGR03437 family)
VNAASYAQPISPTSIVAIFGTNLATKAMTATDSPLPLELGGTSVLVNGNKAPLFFVSPGQINFQLPAKTPAGSFTYTPATIQVTTASGSSGAVQVPVFLGSPAIFSADGSGCGQAAALNVAADGSVSPNSPTNSAAPGDYVSIYGTGLDNFYSPGDGIYTTGPWGLGIVPGMYIDGVVPQEGNYQYAGLAPFLVGVDQINFQIPTTTREGCAVPVSFFTEALISPTLSVSVHTGGGQCVDPPIQSYGTVSLTKTTTTGGPNPGVTETLSASFPAAPGLKMPQVTLPPAGSYTANIPALTPVSRACVGNPQLSAGAISVTSAGGQTATVAPQTVPEGVSYSQALPSGFIQPGQYVFSAPGSPVAFQGALSVGSPIQIQTALPPGTQISSSSPLVLNWTGGDPGALVKIDLMAGPGSVYNAYDEWYTTVGAGSITLSPICMGHSVETGGNGVTCSFGIPSYNNAQIVFEVSSAPTNVTQINAQGITQSVQLSWTYRYVFAGLSLQ